MCHQWLVRRLDLSHSAPRGHNKLQQVHVNACKTIYVALWLIKWLITPPGNLSLRARVSKWGKSRTVYFQHSGRMFHFSRHIWPKVGNFWRWWLSQGTVVSLCEPGVCCMWPKCNKPTLIRVTGSVMRARRGQSPEETAHLGHVWSRCAWLQAASLSLCQCCRSRPNVTEENCRCGKCLGETSLCSLRSCGLS